MPTPTPTPHPLTIASMRQREYPGSDITIEETLEPEVNYQRYLASYQSEGLKIYALLTVPNGEKPPTGWPVIVFNHGYIPPAQYRTTERYVAYVDWLARNGYIVFRSDYRGHANSFLDDLSGPLQLHHGTADTSVPVEFSETLYQQVVAAGKTVEYYTYAGADHNLASSFGLAMQRTIEFFNTYVKGP